MMRLALIVSAVAAVVMKDDIREAKRYLAGGGWDEVKKELRQANWGNFAFQLISGVPLELCGGQPSYGPGDVLVNDRDVVAA